MPKVLKYHERFGRPNSLLNAALPRGHAVMIPREFSICHGFPGFVSHGCVKSGIFRCEVMNPVSPAFGFAPLPTAPSSRISPPDPVAAPGYGDILVG
jgi:hypothetical protein